MLVVLVACAHVAAGEANADTLANRHMFIADILREQVGG
jgi:hypothetical protein